MYNLLIPTEVLKQWSSSASASLVWSDSDTDVNTETKAALMGFLIHFVILVNESFEWYER